MTDPRPSRRELMKPAQLIGLAFAAALFGGVITLMSMGVLQEPRPVPPGEMHPHLKAWVVAGVVAGIVFIVTLVTIALLLLAVDPAQLQKQIDRPVLLPDEEATSGPDAAASASGEVPGEVPGADPPQR